MVRSARAHWGGAEVIALLAAAISFALIEAPHHGKAFVVDSDLKTSRLMTSGDAIGCSTTSGCPDAVYVRFPDQPDLRYPAIVWKPPGFASVANSVQMLTVVRGELTPLPVADRVAMGDAISTVACAGTAVAGTYVASVSPALDVLRTTVAATPDRSGCPLVASAGVAGVLVPDVNGLSANPGPLAVASLYVSVTRYVRPSWLTTDPRADAETALLTATYPTDYSALLQLSFNAPAASLCRRADAGDANAAFGCAQAFLHGYGAPRDLARAIPYLQTAANHSVRNAGALLAQTQTDDARNQKQFAQSLAAAQQGDPVAMRTVGEDYRVGAGVTQNEVRAFVWLDKAATAGDSQARTDVGNAFGNGSGVIADQARASQYYAPPAPALAPAAPAVALTPAGKLARAKALSGTGDVVAAANAYIDAAKTGDPQNEYEAAMYLGHTYGVLTTLKAAGMIDADEQSDAFLDDAVKKHYWRADWMALGGNYVSRPMVITAVTSPALNGPVLQAVADTLPAANARDGYAEQELAEVYLTEWGGVPRDCAKGIMWGTRALADGGISAESVLGAELAGTPYDRPGSGAGTCLDAPGGLEMLKTAALKGGIDAQWRMATLYETGHLVPKDMNEAIRWYRLAASLDLTSQQWLEAHGLSR